MNSPQSLVRRISIPVAGLLLVLAGRLSAATYFVDYTAGADTNNGMSTSAPWRHCPGDPAASGTAGSAKLAAGDTVNFKGGVAYVLTGATGIRLTASGTATSPIRFDGNSAGVWGSGRARFTDNHGANRIAAFSASSAIAYVTFASLEFDGIGGAATLPSDSGTAVAARFGAGLVFDGGVANTIVTDCVFHDLGYAFNGKPMNAAAINGTGISAASCTNLTISKCDFSHVGAAIELFAAKTVSGLAVTNCTFHDNVCWTIDLPPGVTVDSNVTGCTETNDDQFAPSSWTGYGASPRTAVLSVAQGASLTLRATAAATPLATFQWRKDGTAIAGATAAALTLTSVASGDAGTYTVIAANSAGVTESNEALVTVNSITPPNSTSSSPTTPSSPTTTTDVPAPAPAPVDAVAPRFTTQPAGCTVAAGDTATFTVVASGTPAPTYQWYKALTPIAGATSSTLTLKNVTSANAGSYHVIATNDAGATPSYNATLVVEPAAPAAAIAPSFTTQPAGCTVAAGDTATFTVVASGTPAPTYQWYKALTPIAGATSSTLTLKNVTSATAGSYHVVAINEAGTRQSYNALLTVTTPTVTSTSAPAITTQPAWATATVGASARFTVVATGTPAPTYQWQKDGVDILGATDRIYALPVVKTADAGKYDVVVTNSAGSVTSAVVMLKVIAASGIEAAAGSSDTSTAPRLANLSVRAPAGSGDKTLILGFVVHGTAPKSLLLRGVGPALSHYGVTHALPDPVLSLYSGSTLLDRNANWTSLTDAADVAATAQAVGGFALPQAGGDSALLPTIAAGTYTAQLTSAGAKGGTGLVELYDADGTSDSSLANVSVRTDLSPGESPILGFSVTGTGTKRLLIRAVGPTLVNYGVTSVNADPQLAVYSGSTPVAGNDNWGGDAALADTFTSVGAFPLKSADSRDAALVFEASAGTYSVVVSGVGGAPGVVVVELYELP